MTRRRAASAAAYVASVAVAALVGTALVGVVSVTVYSPRALVDSYLASLARGDVSAVLALPGVDPGEPGTTASATVRRASRDLLRDGAVTLARGGTIGSIRGTGDRRTVTLTSAAGTIGSLVLERARSGPGPLDPWRFAVSPLAAVDLTVENATAFRVEGPDPLDVDPRAARTAQQDGFSSGAVYALPAASRLTVSQSDRYTRASTVEDQVPAPPSRARLRLVAEPTPALESAARRAVVRDLDACARQAVLQPTGCPFGTEIDDRVLGAPSWTVTRTPDLDVVPGAYGWRAVGGSGRARLEVRVQSLFDGSIDVEHRDVPFLVDAPLALGPDGTVSVADR